MKAQNEIANMIAVIIFVFSLIALGTLVLSNYIHYTVALDSLGEETLVIDAAYLFHNCLKGPGQAIDTASLDGFDISTCRLPGFYLEVQDIESGKEWTFGEESGDREHSILVELDSEEGMHLGRLYVRA